MGFVETVFDGLKKVSPIELGYEPKKYKDSINLSPFGTQTNI